MRPRFGQTIAFISRSAVDLVRETPRWPVA